MPLPNPPLCHTHRGYRALRRPRVLCEACWTAWVHAQDDRARRQAHVEWLDKQPKNPDGTLYDKHNDPDSCWYG